jgi:putative mRNA 3-end processing factor
MDPLLTLTDQGLYCAAGDFHIDPWQPVERAVITHAHADHLCPGSRTYVTARDGAALVRARVGDEAIVEAVPYGETIARDGVRISLHPAGHILGSAQVRIERGAEVWVVSGDYKLGPDPTCAPFASLPCHTFVTECTFGLPVFRWRPEAEVFAGINDWWRANREAGKASVLFAYPVGKAQRVLAGVDASIGPIHTHGSVERYTALYRDAGVALPATSPVTGPPAGALVVAPPLARNTPWLRKLGPVSTALASGWMRIRGARRRQSLDRGFVLSDHADWPGLMSAIESSGASQIWAVHGYRNAVARWLQEKGLDAQAVETRTPAGAEEDA